MQYGDRTGRRIAVLAISRAISGAITVVLAACAVPPAPQQPKPLRTADTLGDVASLSGGAAQFPADRWWSVYGDPGLDAVIAEALANSPDMAVAAARIRAADAAADRAGGALSPTLTADGTVGGVKQSYNMGIPAQFVPKGVIETGKLSATLGLNLDLWGRGRAGLAAARGEAEAARVDAAQARLLLASGVALSWGHLAQLNSARDLALRSAGALTGVERLTAQRVSAGIDNRADHELAISRRAGAEQALAALDELIALERNRLSALIGAGPDRAGHLPAPAPNLARISGVPANLAASLIGRRPDIVSARLRAEAASARVTSARRAFYPDINLVAVAGLQSLGLGQLFNSGSSFASFGPAISLPIFDGNRLTSNYNTAGAAYDEAVARYDQTLLAALREVADVLDSKRALAQRLSAARTAAQSADQAARLARLRHGEGIANLLQLLTAEDTALASQRALTELEARAFLLDVTLVRALGGGFAAPLPGTEQPTP
ncbi:efflux transporter outer membrane subunit [Novosphingobium sp.]|uniref:efflux transporter outer membrane subunit n=1 Tax=Novosphingobium sp. TaxID=1874826 RepID=UPI0027360F61|nr:efflux transporter outer membrane subunit [Novosphingobium sp.]MDP3907325.1 efflux transporter outer membrane subunit [Novosphingobium sp.]